jgi:hypothetical protein
MTRQPGTWSTSSPPSGHHAEVSSSLAWWQTLVSGAVGGGITLGGQRFAALHQSQAAREARADERREVRAARRDAFELTQLEELEAVVLRMSTAIFAYRASSPQSIEITHDTPEGAEFHAARRGDADPRCPHPRQAHPQSGECTRRAGVSPSLQSGAVGRPSNWRRRCKQSGWRLATASARCTSATVPDRDMHRVMVVERTRSDTT